MARSEVPVMDAIMSQTGGPAIAKIPTQCETSALVEAPAYVPDSAPHAPSAAAQEHRLPANVQNEASRGMLTQRETAGKLISGIYEIQTELGKGKFSVVYIAKNLKDGSKCALKKINIFDMMDPKQREKCLKEVSLLRNLDHPHIVKFLESFIENNELYILVEWAERGDLKRLIRKAQAKGGDAFPEVQVCNYVRQISSALDYMHNMRVMHRDLKPANIFIADDGDLKVGDLGLGRLLTSQTLEAFSKVGTPLYMSPEVLKGNGYGVQSDMWSLGCVAYELCMLASPFKQGNQVSLYELFQRISKGVYPPLNQKYSTQLQAIIDQMLHLDPKQRPTARHVLEGVTAIAMKASRAPPAVLGLLVMEDIVEKLKLLDYERFFLYHKKWRPFNMASFVAPAYDKDVNQVERLVALFEWLLSLRKSRTHDAGPDGAAGPPQNGDGDLAGGPMHNPKRFSLSSDFAGAISDEVEALGIKMTLIQHEELRRGYGDNICVLLNDVINRELVRRDFHFKPPMWGEEPLAEEVDEILLSDDEEMEHSCAASDDECEAIWEEPPVPQVSLVNKEEPMWRMNPVSDDAARMRQCCRSVLDAVGKSRELCDLQATSLRKQLGHIWSKEEILNSSTKAKRAEGLRRRNQRAAMESDLRQQRDRVRGKLSTVKELSRQIVEKHREIEEASGTTKAPIAEITKSLDRLREETRTMGIRTALLSAELFQRRKARTLD